MRYGTGVGISKDCKITYKYVQGHNRKRIKNEWSDGKFQYRNGNYFKEASGNSKKKKTWNKKIYWLRLTLIWPLQKGKKKINKL